MTNADPYRYRLLRYQRGKFVIIEIRQIAHRATTPDNHYQICGNMLLAQIFHAFNDGLADVFRGVIALKSGVLIMKNTSPCTGEPIGIRAKIAQPCGFFRRDDEHMLNIKRHRERLIEIEQPFFMQSG